MSNLPKRKGIQDWIEKDDKEIDLRFEKFRIVGMSCD